MCESKFVEFIQPMNFALRSFSHFSDIFVKKIEFLIFESVFLNQNKIYTPYQKMCEYKFVELFLVNNLVY